MSYFRNVSPHLQSDNEFGREASSVFRRHSFSTRKFQVPRRYILALLLFLLLPLKQWKNLNVIYILTSVIALDMGKEEKISLGAWTKRDLENFTLITSVIDLLAQIPGAILIFKVGSHKYLVVSSVLTSILHMLTPTVLRHHSVSLIIVLIGRILFETSIFTAVISMWKDWAPMSERTKLIVFSMAGLYIENAARVNYGRLFYFITSDESFYFSGIAGLVWALLWYNITFETPQNDPRISQKELLYLENSIPSDLQQKTRLKAIPWKSILTSKQVAILCIIFLKTGCSATAINIGCILIAIHLEQQYNTLSFFVPFLLVFSIVILCSAILADYLTTKFRRRTLLIRKCFLCGGFALQCLFMFGTLSPSNHTKALCFAISYIIYAASLPGFITLALDLSPRYVAITSGIVYTAFFVEPICMRYFIEGTVSFLHLQEIFWLMLIDAIFSLVSAVLFAIWGEVDEQLWTLTFFQRPNGRISCPNGREDAKIEPETV